VASDYTVDVMLRCAPGAEAAVAAGGEAQPAGGAAGEELHALSVSLAEVDAFSSVKLKLPKDVSSADGRFAVLKVLHEVEKRFADGVPLLDPKEDMKIEARAAPPPAPPHLPRPTILTSPFFRTSDSAS